MTWPELTPITPPLSCFGLEYQKHDPVCVKCPHSAECQKFMRSRLHKIPLSSTQFQILPEAYALRFNVDEDDPEIPHLQRVYILCYETIFGRPPASFSLGRFAQKIVDNARRADCSVRLFILANMLGYRRMDQDREAKTAFAKTYPFTPWRLTDATALERARNYAEICRKEFGAFTLSTLSTLAETESDENSLESRMFNSEVYAGRWLVGYKMRYQGPPYELFYQQVEMDLDPNWLAIEDSYKMLVLDTQSQKGNQELRRHRYSVIQTIGFLKRHREMAAVTFKTRQDIMPKAVNKVLEHFGYQPTDFDIEDKPVTNPLELWVSLGRAIQHFNLLQYLHGGDSIFNS